ncbi:MAG: sortase [Firmicutes bacterium]|nr:sortase [Bacillota bacterium]
MWLIILLVAAVFAFGAYFFTHMKSSNAEAEAVLSSMEQLIPGFGLEIDPDDVLPGTSSGGDGSLMALSVNDKDIVGCLEIPALDVRAPIMDKGSEEPYFVTWVSGSPAKGPFRLKGGREDVFRRLAKAKPADKVIFTDIDGNRYTYEVTTQYHLKDWAEATNDLLLCYPSDDQTDFVVGCTSVM